MRKIVFFNMPITIDVEKIVYKSEDDSIPTTERAVTYPIIAFLEKTLVPEDDVKVVLLIKEDELGNYKKYLAGCREELDEVAQLTGAKLEIKSINTEYAEKKSIHDGLLLDIVNELEPQAHIIADITYGPKDLPIVVFAGLNFAEKFYECEIDNIIYGQVTFVDHQPTNGKICDMASLYYLTSVVNAIPGADPEKAKQILQVLLSM